MRITAFALACLAACWAGTPVHAASRRVSVATFVEHPALDQAMKGVLDGLKDAGITEANGYRIGMQSAQGSPVMAGQIARKFAGGQPNGIVAPLSTPVAQSMVAAIPDIPVVFSAVSDAVGSTCSAGYGRKSWTTRSCSPNENTDIGTVLATYSTEEMAWIC